MREDKSRGATNESLKDMGVRQKTVLLVEDDRAHRTFMEQILKDAGFAAIPAENGLVALARLDTGPRFDLVIMDWDMPALDGLETVRAIRARQVNENAPHIPVIAFTGKRQPGDREKCLAAGMDAYLPKDVWMPKWRSTLLEKLHDLTEGEWKESELAELAAAPAPEKIETMFDLDALDPAALQEVKNLLRGGFSSMVDEYLEDAQTYINTIREGLEKNDLNKIERGSHPLKSNSKGLGLTAVAAIATAINLQARESAKNGGSVEFARSLLPQLEEALKRASKTLRAEAKK